MSRTLFACLSFLPIFTPYASADPATPVAASLDQAAPPHSAGESDCGGNSAGVMSAPVENTALPNNYQSELEINLPNMRGKSMRGAINVANPE